LLKTIAKILPRTIRKETLENSLGDNTTPPPYQKRKLKIKEKGENGFFSVFLLIK